MPTASRQPIRLPAAITAAPASRLRGFLAALIVLATLISFGSVVSHDFVYFDDDQTLAENKSLNPPSLQSVLAYWNPNNEFMALYVPVTYTVWGVCAAIGYIDTPDDHGWHLNPYIFHGASLIVHLINALLVFGLLLRLTKKEWPAAMGAMVFALHPMQVEAVAWTSGLKDLLCAMFILLTLRQYVLYADPDSQTFRPRRRVHFALAVLFTALGILSKPTAMVAPLMCGVVGYFLLCVPLKKTALSVAIALLLISPLIIKASGAQPASPIISGPVYLRPFIASFTLGFYLYKLIWPAHLAMDYSWYPQRILATQIAYVTAIVPLVLLIAVVATRKRIPWIAAAILLSVFAILPVLGLSGFQFQYHSTVGDHYFYPAMFGVALAASFVLQRFSTKPAYITAGMLLLAMAIRSFLQMPNFATNPDFFDHILAVNPRSVFAHVNYARYYAENAKLMESAKDDVTRLQAPRAYAAAAEQLQQAIDVRPDFAKSYESYCYVLLVRRQFPKALIMAQQAMQLMREQTDRFKPLDVVDAEINYSRRFLNAGQNAPALEFADEAIAGESDNPDPHQLRADALLYLHRLPEALKEMDATVELSAHRTGEHETPAHLRVAFGVQLWNQGELDAAEGQLRSALLLNPPDPGKIRETLQLIADQRKSQPTTNR